MGYTVQWVTDHLGITRDMLRYYEKQKLLEHSVNKYREYSREELEKIWNIKLLITIGFSASEIYAMMHDPRFDFYNAITEKVERLEQKHQEEKVALEIAKTIKLTGRIPTVKEVGSHQFEDFMAYVREKWNFYKDPQDAPYMHLLSMLGKENSQAWTSEDVQHLTEVYEKITSDQLMHAMVSHTYFQVLSEMRDMNFQSEPVQRIVGRFHQFFAENNKDPMLDGEITPQFMAKYMARLLIEGDIAIQMQRNYSPEGCLFIAKALAYYGGYEISEL